MILKSPFQITARLMAGLRIGSASISLERFGRTQDGRDRFRYFIDLPDSSEHVGNDLKSGVGGSDLQEAFSSLLSFLAAAAESYPDGENADLFPRNVCEWAQENSDELSMLQIEIDETANLIEA